MRLFRLPIAISLLVHIAVFLSIAWIKFGDEYINIKATPVEFFKQKQDRLIKRSIPTRPKYMVGNITNQYTPTTAVQINIVNSTSTIVYSDIQSAICLESIKFSNYESGSFMGEYHIPNKPISLNGIPLQANVRPNLKNICYNGDKFINDRLSVLEKPNINIHFVQKDNRSLRKFLNTIRKKIESNKKYPVSAMKAGIEGRSGVRLAILKDGQLENAEITDSSGNVVLDRAALESVYNAIPFPPTPPDIESDKIEISVYIVFELSQFGRR